jgi:hypothetical protein
MEMRPYKLLLAFVLACGVAGAAPVLAGADRATERAQEQEPEKEKAKEKSPTEAVDELRKAAAAEAAEEEETESAEEESVFKSGELALQALNPEISVTGDLLGNYQSGNEDAVAWDTVFRTLGLHFEAYLDPYSRFKAAVPVSAEGAELGEAYFTRYGVLPNTNVTLGKFRQQFGVVNRWHKHALDWFDFPLALRSIFGPGGLNQVGLSAESGGSTGPVVHGVIVEVTDGDNGVVFDRNERNRPSILGRYTAYQDLSSSTYLDIGVTGLVGWNDEWTVADSSFSDPLTVVVYGADLVLVWEPTDRMRYRNIEWRSEAYFMDKEIYAPDGSGVDRVKPWGFYSLLQTKVSRTLEIGVRYDYFAPDAKSYAPAVDRAGIPPLAVGAEDAYRWLAGSWFTWWQSPFVKFRVGYTYESGRDLGPDVHAVTFQTVFAAGPHKHERY